MPTQTIEAPEVKKEVVPDEPQIHNSPQPSVQPTRRKRFISLLHEIFEGREEYLGRTPD